MDSFTGRILILWTVRIAVLLYAIAAWRYLFVCRNRKSSDSVYKITWAAAWAFCVVHVAFAFHFEHHWSHTAAIRHTAEMTERVVGLNWGGGLWINYAFLTWWGVDAVRQFCGSQAASSSLFHAVAAFMFFNATAVFGPSWWWIPVSVCFVAVVIAVIYRRGREPDSVQFPPNAG